uniref:Uncharacterized protein n=1 Tax=Myoviridae sp. ctino4 TaxID=2826686 RepID=A0A8S5MU82_9CAUD|nr:MAG TPA: hypothetical protein [Myoviridae sp. ctino4]
MLHIWILFLILQFLQTTFFPTVQPFSLANTAAQVLLTPVSLDFQPVIHSPQISQYTSVSTVLLIAIFIPSLSHDLIEILYVSGVYQIFRSVWDLLCANAFVCYCSDTGVILEYPRLEVAWELYKPVSTFSVKQFLFLPPIHSPLPAALSIHFRYLSHSARSSTSKVLLSLISSGIIRYFLFTRAKLAAAWATLFFVQPVFSVTCLAISRSSNTCFPF